MRLLNTRTGEFQWFENPREVRYAILSHVWSTDLRKPEQSFETTHGILKAHSSSDTSPALAQYAEKIQRVCKVALKDGFEFVWVDSSCIDKSSSAELSEAINSMYDWYHYSGTCYAFLHDVQDAPDPADSQAFWDDFSKSKWFERGWTLQELLAPSVLVFLSGGWNVIGSKHSLAPVVADITGISCDVLTFKQSLDEVSVATKMSWAASRQTTRVEDEAYALMGIFGVHIPICYGEGRYAFIRLQEAIVKLVPDQTIFAWGHLLLPYPFQFLAPGRHEEDPVNIPEIPIPPSSTEYLLASSARNFKGSSAWTPIPPHSFLDVLGVPQEHIHQVFTETSYGMHACLPLLTVQRDDVHFRLPSHLVLLACQDAEGRLLALLLRSKHRNPQSTSRDFLVGDIVGPVNALLCSTTLMHSYYYRLTSLSREDVAALSGKLEMTTMYISHRPSARAQMVELEESTHALLRDSREHFEIRLSGWSRSLLEKEGYLVSPVDNTSIAPHDGYLHPKPAPRDPAVVISNAEEHITIHVGRCHCIIGREQHLLGFMVSSRYRTCPLQEQFLEEHYRRDHSAHIESWYFRGGFSSTDIMLQSSTKAPMVLRLTFSNGTKAADHTTAAKLYFLGVEIWTLPRLSLSGLISQPSVIPTTTNAAPTMSVASLEDGIAYYRTTSISSLRDHHVTLHSTLRTMLMSSSTFESLRAPQRYRGNPQSPTTPFGERVTLGSTSPRTRSNSLTSSRSGSVTLSASRNGANEIMSQEPYLDSRLLAGFGKSDIFASIFCKG